ncbi:TrmB family transcriptional regulator [Patescibacteria group bacterium]
MKILEQLGLSANEAKIYTTLLQLGGGSVRNISQQTDIKRPTVYFCLDGLTSRGLVVENITRGKKTYGAAEPEELRSLIQKQKAGLAETERRLVEVLPKLKTLAHKKSMGADVRVYEGVEPLWKFTEQLLRQRKDLLFIYSGETLLKHTTAEKILKKFTKRRRQFGGSKVYAITDKNPISEKRIKEGDTDFREIKLLNSKISFNSIFCLIGNTAVLISLDKKPKAVVIENEAISEILGFLFWSLWKAI